MYRDGELEFLPKDSTNPTKFLPVFEEHSASNWFDADTNLLYVLVKGGEPIEIRVAPVVQVRFVSFKFYPAGTRRQNDVVWTSF